ncbi:sensor histidine kinase [Sediminitomix flava]|uniref:histidine kinase n=1 Tax=Sediminitomix flava TaxID=379075 RepID=A0A315ZG64_SEDFL|nr:HAMP domain-containing sensor histidine kinase [Sediminitomix flava]PWJ44312.1 signal transduction histidine kinase [Sediminitomix flava]
MSKKLKNIILKIEGDPGTFSFEHRMLNMGSFLACIGYLTFLVTSPYIFQHLIFLITCILSFVGFATLYFFTRTNRFVKNAAFVWGALLLLGLNIGYFFSDGWRGLGSTMMFMVGLALIYMVTPTKSHKYIYTTALINYLGLHTLDYFFDLSYPFLTSEIAYLDTLFVTWFAFWGSYSVLRLSKRDFEEKRREVEKQNQQLEKSIEKQQNLANVKDLILGISSHQYKTPLTIIKGNLEMVKMTWNSDMERRDELFEKSIFRIERAIDRANELIQDVMKYHQADDLELELEETCILGLIESLADEIKDVDPEKRDVTLKVSGDPFCIVADPKQLGIVFTNLISNSLKYSKGAASPIISLEFDESKLVAQIQDFGVGIAEEELQNIFEPFYRSEDQSKTIQGNGLGLFITKKIIHKHGFNISVDSIINHGSKFRIEMPKLPKPISDDQIVNA